MKTFTTTNGVLRSKELEEIIPLLNQGAIIAFPTETVYGIGCLIDKQNAIDKIYAIKDRESTKPLSLHISSPEVVNKYIDNFPPYFERFVQEFWPGPVTGILFNQENKTVGFRYPDSEVALQLIAACGGEIFATSANVSGKTSPISAEDVLKHFSDVVEILIDDGPTRYQTDSTVVLLNHNNGDIVRKGARAQDVVNFFQKSKEPAEENNKKRHVLFVCTGNTCRSPMGEVWLKSYLKSVHKEHLFHIESCGIYACDGMSASSGSVDRMQQEGIDLSLHKSQTVSRSMVERANIIFCMSYAHKKEILNIMPEAESKVIVLNVDDPIGLGGQVYDNCFQDIVEGIKEHIETILEGI
ncbi:L-threonylcarbamoyladenylate synthase [Candidatus Omnitrophota bacterium]